jgi:hypothetical protein
MIKSKICTESDFHNEWFKKWAVKINWFPWYINRKLWEWVMIAQALDERNMLQPGNKGIGFGIGKDPMPSLFASLGCSTVATDLPLDIDTETGKKWLNSNQYPNEINQLFWPNLCDIKSFKKFVSFRPVDMNHIPEDLRDFDFSFSSCAFEHLGSIQNGLDFIINQMDCLKKGGWAVHTTEYNVSSNDQYYDDKFTVTFRRRDLESLVDTLTDKGYFVEELDTSMGSTKGDFFVDELPFGSDPHLRLKVGDFVTTSIMRIVRK